jgi:hypothetical protein
MVTILKESLDEMWIACGTQNIIIFGYYAGNHKAINPKLPE